jgi:hypothetical protein
MFCRVSTEAQFSLWSVADDNYSAVQLAAL